ncbi:MAG: PQQ-dependent sugar dehydrogenase [Phycisphaerales bacterium]|nr:PQQ-dependent sugar dehydrogenase [Hyphomonadaceae bacterium]
MLSRAYHLFAIFVFAACTGETSGQPAALSGSPVEQGAPNTDFQPAFAVQTRAPHVRSGIAIEVEETATRLDHPWAVEALPDGRLLVTERAGRLRVVTPGAPLRAPVAGLPPVDARGQGGLLDVALSPDFARDRMIYWSYAEPRGDGENGTSVARGRLNAEATRVENVQVIFRQQPAWRSTGHFGSRLVFDREGRLYITLGDRQRGEPRQLAQDASAHIGKIVRINADGSIPADNPFVGRANARPEIWSIGHRNVQGAALHPETGALWAIEHGPQGGDEINIVQAGRNYGWPIISYGEDYGGAPMGEGVAVREGMEQPVYYWDPVIAPGGMLFYRGDLFPWRGDILVAGLRAQTIVRLELDGGRVDGEERLLTGQEGRVRDIAEAADGALWVVTDEDNGRLLRLTPRA